MTRIPLDGFRFGIKKTEIENVQNILNKKIQISSKVAKEDLKVEKNLEIKISKQNYDINFSKQTGEFCVVKIKTIKRFD